MSQRERVLAIAVGGLLGLFALFMVFRGVQNGLRTRDSQLTSLQRKIGREENAKVLALRDQRLVRDFKLRSLNADPEQAHLEFDHWLEQQVKEVGLQRGTVRWNDFRRATEDYKELTYTVLGDGNIKQVTDLLYRIQAADTLHRIERFSLRQGADPGKLKLELSIAALSMGEVDAPKAAVGKIVESKLGKSLEEYKAAIVTRNMFAPANNAPKWELDKSKTVELGKQLDWNLKATDADGHGLEFRLVDAPEKAEIKNRKLVWKPSELGEYTFEVEVTDDGVPAKTDVATVKVKVIPERVAPQEKPKDEFDEATVTKLTGFVQGPTYVGPKIWLYLQSEGENLTLGAGDKIDIGKWQGVVKAVKPDSNVAWLESADGESFELALGQTLSDAKPMRRDETL